MLTFYVLNVGHGSSIVVEIENNQGRFFGVIDSNANAGAPCRALEKLQERGAERLSFVCLTHPHKDHFSGLYEVVLAFRGKIDHFYSCPLGDLLSNRPRLKTLAKKLKAMQERTDSIEHRRAAHEFLQLLCWADMSAKSGEISWFECSGDFNGLAPPGFAGVEIATLLPPNKAKGQYIQQIERQDRFLLGGISENEISLALEFAFSGLKVIIGGDGTRENWESRRRYENAKNTPIDGQIVNLPHHGSRYDCDSDVVEQLFSKSGDRFAITSANGLSHPDIEVIHSLETRKIRPYCTNLIPQCGANARRLLVLSNYEPQFARWLREVADNPGVMQVCQGDVTLRVSRDGDFHVIPQFANACGFRGDYDLLFSGM